MLLQRRVPVSHQGHPPPPLVPQALSSALLPPACSHRELPSPLILLPSAQDRDLQRQNRLAGPQPSTPP